MGTDKRKRIDPRLWSQIAKTAQEPPAHSAVDSRVGSYADAPPEGYSFPGQTAQTPAPARTSRGGPILGGAMEAMKQSPEGLGWLQQGTTNAAFNMQKQAVEGEQTPERGNTGWKEGLTAAVITMIMNAMERGSGKGFSEGFQRAEADRIDADYRKQVEKAEQQKQIRHIEAQQKLAEAQGMGDRRREMMQQQSQERGFAHDKEMQGLRNEGAVAKTTAGSDARIMEMIARLPDDKQRITAATIAHRNGILSDADFEAVKATASQATSSEGLADARTQTENETRAGKVSKLLAEGKGAEWRAEMNRATAVLTGKKVSTFNQEFGMRMNKLKADADKALAEANAKVSGVSGGGTGPAKGVTPTSFFNAMNSIGGALAKVGALKAQLDANDKILTAKMRALSQPGAKPSDPLTPIETEKAEIQELLDANVSLRAGYDEMERRQNQRLQMLSQYQMQQGQGAPGQTAAQSRVPGKGRGTGDMRVQIDKSGGFNPVQPPIPGGLPPAGTPAPGVGRRDPATVAAESAPFGMGSLFKAARDKQVAHGATKLKKGEAVKSGNITVERTK